ncbi:MAG: hypothetical protein EZS28_001422, partial [Streblomastix strix]
MKEFITLHRIDWIRFRAVAEDYFRRGVHFEEAYIEMSETYGGICPEKDTLYRWEKKFNETG